MRPTSAAALLFAASLPAFAQDPAPARIVRIFRAAQVPRIDDDPAWAGAQAADQFVQLSPRFNEPATLPTRVFLMRDDTHLYVLAQMDDPDPSAIQRQLARRDSQTQADTIELAIDGYHDRRNAQVFQVNAAGVQRDTLVYDDIQEDARWDAVWDSAVTVDANGWTAELAIPLAQLKFNPRSTTWGVQVARFVVRLQESSGWSPIAPNRGVRVSQFGEARLDVAPPPSTKVELRPYAMAGASTYAGLPGDPFHPGMDGRWSLGGDLKWGLGTSWYLNATINPDFGQVEADPAQVNLTDQQLFYPEQRPFFLEGVDLFAPAAGVNNSNGTWGGPPNLFYTRRIGAPPSAFVPAPDGAEYVDRPQMTPIYGAMKLTGRSGGGFSLGVLDALTAPVQEHYAALGGDLLDQSTTVQPLSHFLVVRGQQELSNGSTVGFLGTAVHRRLEDVLDGAMPGLAHTGGIDWNLRTGGGNYFVAGRLVGSRIDGSAAAITRLQRNFVRYAQRPDAHHLGVDPSRTSLLGLSGQLRAGRLNAEHWLWEAQTSFTSPFFEANDIGFQNRADELAVGGRVTYQDRQPGPLFRNWSITANGTVPFSFGGDLLIPKMSLGYNALTQSFIPFGLFFIGYTYGNDDRLLRGGPLAKAPVADIGLNFNVGTDVRQKVRATLYGNAGGSTSGGEDWILGVALNAEPVPALTLSLNPQAYLAKKDAQYVSAYDDATASATFDRQYLTAHLANWNTAIEARADWTFTPKISLQTFARASVVTGAYDRYRYFATPGTRDFLEPEAFAEAGSTLSARAPGSPIDFNFANPNFVFSSLQANAVFRWEYSPGATLFLVYQVACGGTTGGTGAFDVRAYGNLCRGSTPDNTVMAKLTYWMSP